MPISPAAHYISCLLHQLPITTASTLERVSMLKIEEIKKLCSSTTRGEVDNRNLVVS